MSNELIYAMSAKGEMKIEQFYDLLNSIPVREDHGGEEAGYDIRNSVVRILESLGYCEFDFKKRKVFMCPPCLIKLPSIGTPKAVLTGARSPSLMKVLKETVKEKKDGAFLLNTPQRSSVIKLPPLFCIEADETSTLEEIADKCGIKYRLDIPAAWLLIQMSKSVNDIKDGLDFVKRGWDPVIMKVFNEERLVFAKSAVERDECLVEYKNQTDNQFYYFYWKDAKSAEIGKDWGRYAILSSKGKRILIYDKKMRYLAVPKTVPLPTILARALVFCTGYPPFNGQVGPENMADIPSGHYLDIYSGVTEPIAVEIAEKLGQILHHQNLSIGGDN